MFCLRRYIYCGLSDKEGSLGALHIFGGRRRTTWGLALGEELLHVAALLGIISNRVRAVLHKITEHTAHEMAGVMRAEGHSGWRRRCGTSRQVGLELYHLGGTGGEGLCGRGLQIGAVLEHHLQIALQLVLIQIPVLVDASLVKDAGEEALKGDSPSYCGSKHFCWGTHRWWVRMMVATLALEGPTGLPIRWWRRGNVKLDALLLQLGGYEIRHGTAGFGIHKRWSLAAVHVSRNGCILLIDWS